MKADRTEEDLTDILEEEVDAKKATLMFLRLKLLIVYHSIQTVGIVDVLQPNSLISHLYNNLVKNPRPVVAQRHKM